MWSGDDWCERVDVSDWCEDYREPVGSSKGGVRWLVEPGKRDDLWLHKDVPGHKNGSVPGTDWAEVIASRVGESLGVPCARTRLCRRAGRRGSLSYNVRSSGYDFVAGGDYLKSLGVPGYVRYRPKDEVRDEAKARDPCPGVKRPGHHLKNIREALSRIGPPESFAGDGSWSGFDVFVGFLILDAIIANQDRHEDNWAVLRAQLSTGRDLLAASYDHGSSLGHNLLDSKREAMLRNREELSAFACRGKAKRFEHSESRGPVTLVKLAAEAMEMVDPAVASWWRDRLKEIEDFRPLLGYPELTEVYSSDQLPALLEQRVMSPRRPDFEQYVGMLGLSAGHATPWEQVVASGGGRAGDTLQFMRLPTAEDGRARAQFLCNGIRHIPGYRATLRGRTIRVTREEQDRALDGLRAGLRLHLEPEPDNPEDANSVLVMAQDVPLGWVPRLLAPSMGELMASGVTDVTVDRVAPGAPAHLRLVLELDAPAPPGFTFDPEGRWEPLAVQG